MTVPWQNIGALFQNNIALNRGDGLYVIPSFSGFLSKVGHWYVTLILIENGLARGYTLDSLGTGYNDKKEGIRQNIVLSFHIPNSRQWFDVPIMTHIENECGPRTIWNMVQICLAHKRHIRLEHIFRRLSTLGGISRSSSARRVREDAKEIVLSQSGLALFHRIFSRSDVHTSLWENTISTLVLTTAPGLRLFSSIMRLGIWYFFI